MKKIGVIIGTILLLAGLAWATDFSQRSDVKTASAAIDTSAGLIDGILIATDGTNNVNLDLLDAASAALPKITPTIVITTSSTNRATALSFSPPWRYVSGLYVSANSAGTYSYVVSYRRN